MEILKIEEYSHIMREQKQVRPIDNSQDWSYLNEYRDGRDVGGEEICGITYRWYENGTICDGANKHQRLEYQYNEYGDGWKTYKPEIYKIGDIIELDSDECGTYEYKEEQDDDYVCGSVLIEQYGSGGYDKYSKYLATRAYIKRKNESEWKMLDCGPVLYKVIKKDSFECGWVGYKDKIIEGCGYELKEQYPFINLPDTSSYRVSLKNYYKTAPYPTNNDEMTKDDWIWEDNPKYDKTISYSTIKQNDCGCGYYYTQWDITDEFICGSELGDGYVKTTQYRKEIENKYCEGELIGTTGNYRWVGYNNKSCECGYRLSGYSIDTTYEYVCGNEIGLDNGYMYYKTYYYEQCDDDINKIYDRTYYYDNIKYVKASHSQTYENSCEYDENTQANTTRVVTTYRTFYNENTKAYEIIICEGSIIDVQKYTNSSYCGYQEKWTVSGEVCCGYLEYESPVMLDIVKVEGNWIRNGYTFTSNDIGDSKITDVKIYFNVSKGGYLNLTYDVSSEGGYDKLYYSAIDGSSPTNGGISGVKTGTISFQVSQGEHYIILRYQKDSSYSAGRDNAIVELSIDTSLCNRFARYYAEYYQYSVDGGETWRTPEPIEYRYGNLIEYSSEKCGYVPELEHWVLICEDVTYENANVEDGCVECQIYQNAPTMFAIEKKQISYDNGVTWEDAYNEDGSLVTRTQQLLKWKAEKCGYSGATYEYRWTDEYCDGGHKYGTKTMWESNDGGKTWAMIEGSSVIALKEENSGDCV